MVLIVANTLSTTSQRHLLYFIALLRCVIIALLSVCGLVVTVSARGASNDGNAATPQSTIMNGASLMTSPVVPLAYQQQPLIPLGPAAFHSQYTPVCMSGFMLFVSS